MTQGVNSVGAAVAGLGGGTKDRAMIAQNFDSFLLLLTTQLKNQSPLDPLDTNQFTQQLVQFASVEQQIKSNDTLNALLTSSRAANISTAASFVGMNVTAEGRITRLADGKAQWTLTAARDAPQAVFEIMDASGNVVATRTGSLAGGLQTFTWDGRNSTGGLAPEGDYVISVSARDASGQSIAVRSEVSGVVDAVELAGNEPTLLIGTIRVPIEHVTSVARRATN